MKITGAELRAVGERGLVLALSDEHGRRGAGEASPLPGYSPDSTAQCEAALRARDLVGLTIDCDQPLPQQLGRASAGLPPAARCALETALLDLVGRRLDVPAWALLGGAAPAPVPLSALVDSPAAARSAWGRGVRAVKLKIARAPFATELALVAEVRDAVPDAELRLDANRALREPEAQVAALAPYRPAFLEEPAPRGPVWLTSPVPLAADESAPEWVTRAPALAVFVLKPMLHGLIGCLGLAQRARSIGLRVVVTHMFDGPLALAAAAALALALPHPLACGLLPHAGLAAWPATELAYLGRHELRVPAQPGLGVELP